jgi:16S rRNA (uracil1498-N3)-methyltransferase
MTAPRFHVGDAPDLALVAGGTVALPEGAAHHALRVLRLAVGDALTLFDGTGGEWAATLVHADRRDALVSIERFDAIERELPVQVTLAMSVIASDPMDSAVRKAVELGVTTIVPITAARTQGVLQGDKAARRQAHWRHIAVAACEQCGRNRVPLVTPALAFADWCAQQGSGTSVLAPGASLTLAAWLAQQGNRAQATHVGITVAVGPEGGYSEGELALARQQQLALVNMGARVLRAETAAIAAVATIAAVLGDAR